MVRVPVRPPPVFTVTEKLTVPGPVPASGEALSHDAFVDTVQGHPLNVAIAMSPLPPSTGIV
jgi:hypothetical protein